MFRLKSFPSFQFAACIWYKSTKGRNGIVWKTIRGIELSSKRPIQLNAPPRGIHSKCDFCFITMQQMKFGRTKRTCKWGNSENLLNVAHQFIVFDCRIIFIQFSIELLGKHLSSDLWNAKPKHMDDSESMDLLDSFWRTHLS